MTEPALPKSSNGRWCCLCEAADPDGAQMCPVSEQEIGPGRGLKHLIANGAYKSAIDAWRSAAPARAESAAAAGTTL